MITNGYDELQSRQANRFYRKGSKANRNSLGHQNEKAQDHQAKEEIMSVIQFPGSEPTYSSAEDDEGNEQENIKIILESFSKDQELFDELLIVGVNKDGRIAWGSSSTDLRSALWMAKAMERIIMDHSLGLTEV
jgi:hypothetical protein